MSLLPSLPSIQTWDNVWDESLEYDPDQPDDEDEDLDEGPRPNKITRPVITPHEGELLQTLCKAVKAVEGKFWCGGSATIGVERPVILYSSKPTDGGEEIWKRVYLGMSVEGFSELHEAANPSPHGVGNRTVYDESYRLARELRVGDFALNFDPIDHGTGIVNAVSAICGSAIRVELYKINSYAEGGFFKAHKDTPKSEGHIGSIVLSLPAPYEGGELVIQHEDRKVTFDWGASMDALSLQWAFFFSDVTHEILPVKKGHRVTLAYDVYKAAEMTWSTLAIDSTTTPIFNVFSEALADPDFLVEGGKVAFSLQHQYPVKNGSSAEKCLPLLKGSDRLLCEVLASLKLQVKLVAVYRLEHREVLGYRSNEQLQVPPPDDFTSWSYYYRRGRYSSDEVLLVSDTFRGINCETDRRDLDIYQELQENSEADIDSDLIWCSRPAGTWAPLSHYITYGNEACLQCSYAAAALLVAIPAAGQR